MTFIVKIQWLYIDINVTYFSEETRKSDLHILLKDPQNSDENSLNFQRLVCLKIYT